MIAYETPDPDDNGRPPTLRLYCDDRTIAQRSGRSRIPRTAPGSAYRGTHVPQF
ncbi:hypothetical protein ACFUEJ_06695 [Gordonia sp. NPDC057258]|uniref:hypothetical protein n=1 Tax=unclassified Gordonia (in: high G+C Gram-positive bacteria) TaxID=2657482 RepID=UPI003629CEC4